MRRTFAAVLTATSTLLALGSSGASADTIIGPYSFDDDAFADVLSFFTPGISFERQVTSPFDRVPTTPEDAVLGSDLASSTIEMQSDQQLDLMFSAVNVVNGAGSDLVVFELFSGVEYGSATINGITLGMSGFSLGAIPIPGTGFSNDVNAAELDLSDFGYAPGAVIANLAMSVTGSGSEYAAFGALNVSQVPLPAPALLLTGGIGLLAAASRRRSRG